MKVENETSISESLMDGIESASIKVGPTSAQVALARRGDACKCPVCGSPADPDAYHCAACRNYFCFHCRARLHPMDIQLECVNPGCQYYSKLMCSICDPERAKEESPAVYAEPVDGYWPLWLLVSIVVGVTFAIASVWWFGLLVGVLCYFGLGFSLQKVGVNIFGKESLVTQQRSSTFRTCICCEQPVREIRTERGNLNNG